MPPTRGDATAGAPATLAIRRSGSGTRIVLIHGFTQTGRSWQEVVARLSRRHEVVTVDLPGHGGSGHLEARDLVGAGRLLMQAGGDATYVGYSMGGRVALHAALACPDAVRRLVLVGTHPGIEDPEQRSARRSADEALAGRLEATGEGRLTIDQFLAEWLAAPLFSHLDQAAAGLEARRENTPPGLARALRTLGTGTQRIDLARLGSLAMPVLVVAGDLDRTYTRLGRLLATMIGDNATFEAIAGAGHAVPFEAPGRFVELLENWLGPAGAP